MAGRLGGTVHAVDADDVGARFDKWLAAPARLRSRSRAAHALLHGQVFLNDAEQTLADASRRLGSADSIRIWIDRPQSAARQGPHQAGPLDIVFEDADLIVVNKPASLLTVPLPEQPRAESLAGRVQAYWRSHGRPPLAVHRLDRDTSGLVVFARSGIARRGLKTQFMERTPERRYLTVVVGVPTPPSGEWRGWLIWDPDALRQRVATPGQKRAFEATSRYVVRESFVRSGTSLLEVSLVTGKRHQIRMQAWVKGHPLVGERVYVGAPWSDGAVAMTFGRQALHAVRLGFAHPRTGEALAFDSRPPEDLERLLERLRGRPRRPVGR